jgi:hypothetical protein
MKLLGSGRGSVKFILYDAFFQEKDSNSGLAFLYTLLLVAFDIPFEKTPAGLVG